MPKRDGYVLHLISNTHWDREWLKTFQENRMALVDTVEELIRLFEKDKRYRHFHLDSQTVPLEDLAAVRPDLAKKLTKYIKNGRLLVGPWYTLPEMNAIEGESIVRNLLTGHAVAKQYGKPMKVGYNPTSNGQVSQLPQIYAGFGIDSILFYRGINRDAAALEFWWEAPDGTKALAFQFPEGRAIFWGYCYLPIVYDVHSDNGESWRFKWETGGLPIRFLDDKEFEMTRVPDTYHEENIDKALKDTVELASKDTRTPHLVMLEGHDQCPPYDKITRLIEDANKRFGKHRMVHNSLPKLIDAVKKNHDPLKTLKGEMRLTNKSGRFGFCFVHAGILSTRLYLKQANRRAENTLFRCAEPMATAAWTLGETYPRPFLDMGLKMLLQNHAHDDICGCSIDKVHADMMYRYSEIETLGREITRRSMVSVIERIDSRGLDKNGFYLTAMNSLPYDRAEVVPVTIDLPASENPKGVTVTDTNGNAVPVQIESARDTGVPVMQDAITRGFPVKRFTAHVDTTVPALGYTMLQIKPAEKPKAEKGLFGKSSTLENEHLRVKINANGTLDITEKTSRATYKGVHYFDDEGECGNAWNIMKPKKDKRVTSLKSRARTKVLVNGPLVSKVEVTVSMKVPASLDADFEARLKKTVSLVIRSVLILRKGSPRLDIETTLDNQALSHRLRMMWPTGLKSKTSYAEMPFDVVERAIGLPKDADKWVDRPREENPQVNFCGVEDGKKGLAILNEGMTDCAVLEDKKRTIAMALIRGFWQGSVWTKEKWPDKGYQCLGEHTYRYSVMPYKGSWQTAGVATEGLKHNVPVRYAEHGWTGKGKLPASASFLRLTPSSLIVDAVKRSEDGKALIVRLHNPGTRQAKGTLECMQTIRSARLVDLEEKPVKTLKPAKNTLKLTVPAKKIITLRLALAKR